MPIKMIPTGGLRWSPDSDENDNGVLLRADNIVPDERGSQSLRMGSKTLHSGLGERVHSLYTANLQGAVYRFAGADDSLFIDGGLTESEDDLVIQPQYKDIKGHGDIPMGDDSYQAFFARGKTKLKYDGASVKSWGIARPTRAATAEAIDAITYTISSFDKTEAVNTPAVVPAMKIKEGTGGDTLVQIGTEAEWQGGWPKNYAEVAEKALAMRPDPGTGRASCQKVWSTDQDFFDFSGNYGGQSDLFDMRVWIQEPRKVDKITIMFGLSQGADPFLDDYYYFDFNIRNNGTVDIKDPSSTAASANAVVAGALQLPLTPQQITKVKTPAEASKILRSIGRFAGSRSRERADTSSASPAWGHLAVTRGQFNRVGGTPGRDWKKVRGFKVVYTAVPGSIEKIYLDDAVWTGGGSRALTGTFKIGYRFVRTFRDKHGNEIYNELSPMSPISKDIVLQQQLMKINIPASSILSRDPQVNQVWIYLMGGWLDTYYRFATASIGSVYMTIDDVSDPNGFTLDDPNVTPGGGGIVTTKLQRLISHGFTSNPSWDNIGTQDLQLKITKSELEAMTENEVYEPGAMEPPDNIVSIAGPWNKRMFCLTDEGWLYPSTQKSPSSYSLYQTIDLRMYGQPFWVAKTISGIFVGCSKDIIRIAGSGENSEDGVTADIYAQPLMVANPPVDRSVCVDGNLIGYRAADGPMMFSGASADPVPMDGIRFLWRGKDRYGISSFDIVNGRFRFAVDNHIIYMIAAEGRSPFATLRYALDQNPKVGSSIYVDKKRYIFRGVVSKRYDVLIGADSSATMTNLVNALNNSDGESGVDYLVPRAHPTVSATIDTAAHTVTLVASSDTKVALSTDEPSFRYDEFETPSNALYRYADNEWRRLLYPHSLMSLHREPDGSLLAGTNNGAMIEIERGSSDDGNEIPVSILTSMEDCGDDAARKRPVDFQIHADTGGSELQVEFLMDGQVASSETFDIHNAIASIHRTQVIGAPEFFRLQIKVTGEVQALSWHKWGFSFIPRAQSAVAMDLGYIIPENGADIAAINQIEFDMNNESDHLHLDIYKLGRLHSTTRVETTPNIRDVYTVVLPRDTKGRRLNLILRTEASGDDVRGFELYFARVRHADSGNVTELQIGSADAAGGG